MSSPTPHVPRKKRSSRREPEPESTGGREAGSSSKRDSSIFKWFHRRSSEATGQEKARGSGLGLVRGRSSSQWAPSNLVNCFGEPEDVLDQGSVPNLPDDGEMEYAMAEFEAGKIPDFEDLLGDEHLLLQSQSPQQVAPAGGGEVSDGSPSRGNGAGRGSFSSPPADHHHKTSDNNSSSRMGGKIPKSEDLLRNAKMEDLLVEMISPVQKGHAHKAGQVQYPSSSKDSSSDNVGRAKPLSAPDNFLSNLQNKSPKLQGGGDNAGRGARHGQPAPPPAPGRAAGRGEPSLPPAERDGGRGTGHGQLAPPPTAGHGAGRGAGRGQPPPPPAASSTLFSQQPAGGDEGQGAEQGFHFTAHAGDSSVPSRGRGSEKGQGSPQDGSEGGGGENSSRGQCTTRGGQRSSGGRDSRGGGRGGSRGQGGIGNGGGDGAQQGGGGDGQEGEGEERKRKKDERGGKRKEEAALALLPDQPHWKTSPRLADLVTGLDAKTHEAHFHASKNQDLGKEQKKAIKLRKSRMTRAVYDPKHSLINYGHRRWPIETSTRFLQNILYWIWPGPLGVDNQSNPWDSDGAFCARLERLIQEFNTYGLPQTIHADLEHEIENTNSEAINPSYRCPCWISLLGEFWYNETDASLLRRLGRDWILSGQHLLLHILHRMITAMTHFYIKQSALTFGINNPHLKNKYSTCRWPKVMIEMTDKMLQTHGYNEIAGRNRSLTDDHQKLFAQLCGIYKYQLARRLTKGRWVKKMNHAEVPDEGPTLSKRQIPRTFTMEEMLYLDKYLLRKKLFNPQFFRHNIEKEFYEAFTKDIAVVEDKKEKISKLIQYAQHFLSNSLADSSRKGFKLRSEAISYYNLLVLKADGDAHIRYDTVNPATNRTDIVELAVSHMEAVMTERCKQTLQGVRQITDFEAKDLANILNAINLENLTQLDLPERLPEGQAAVLPDAPHPATVHPGHQTPPASGSGSGRGGASTSSAATGTADASTSGKKLQSKTVTQPGPAPEPILDEAAMQNFGPGSVQEQIQPILLDRALGEEHDLLCEAMRLILELPSDPSSPGRHSSPPPPNQAFPDVYEELHQDHLNSAKRQKLASEIASTSASQPSWGDPPGSPDGGGGSPPPGGGPGLPHPPSPPGGDGPRLAAFNNFYNDVANNFPDMIELVRPPIALADLFRYLDEIEPRLKPYVYLPVNFPW